MGAINLKNSKIELDRSFLNAILSTFIIPFGCGHSASDASHKRLEMPLKATSSTVVKTPPSQPQLTAIFNFTETTMGGSCFGIFVSPKAFITPTHCMISSVPGKILRIKVKDSDLNVLVESIIAKPFEEVEDLTLLQISSDFDAGTFFKLDDFSHPNGIDPPFNMKLGESNTFCSPVRYSAKGIVQYNCPTLGSMSGTLLTAPDGTPFAIHLGRSAALGYGIVLGSIKGDLRKKLLELKPFLPGEDR